METISARTVGFLFLRDKGQGMDGARVLVVALLLCVAPIGGVVADTVGDSGEIPQQTTEESAGSMTVLAAGNTSEYLAPDPDTIDRTGARTVGLDVAVAIEADGAGLEYAYRRNVIERRYRAATTDSEREAALEEGISELETSVDGLTSTEATAIRQYNAGTVNTKELLGTVLLVSREAAVADETLDWLRNAADDIGADGLADRAATEQVRLIPTTGPVRAELMTAAEGEKALRVHVETADRGIVLATLDRNERSYLREAHDPSAKADAVGDQYGGNPSPALDRFTELYPWTIDSFDAIDATGPEQVRLYRFSASHPHGELETYLDSGSTEILHERQRIDPAEVPTTTVERTENELRVVANITRAGGPLGVSVYDTAGGQLDAEIELNGEAVGSTGGDRLWSVAPRGATTINATHAGETVTIETEIG